VTKTKIALVQMQCGTDPAANLAKAIARIRDAAKQGAQIICLPELFRSQYFCQSEDHANFALAEEIPGPTTTELEKVARETGAVIVASLFEKRGAGVYHNTAAIIDADGQYTAFGKLIKGEDVLDKIATTKTLPGDRPEKRINVDSIKIVPADSVK